jgi:hypothetical protein
MKRRFSIRQRTAVVGASVVAALATASVAGAKPLVAGSRAAEDAPAATTASAAASGVSWDDLAAGLALGAIVVLLATHAARALRRRPPASSTAAS